MSKSSIAVVVLNWNDADLLPKSIGSLLNQSEKCDVIIVDNASEDNSEEVIKSFGDKVTPLWNTRNKGFAGGVNTGIRYALEQGYEYIGLLNNDAEADRDWVKHLKNGLTDETVAATTCSFIHKDKKHYDSTGEIYTTWGLAYPRGRGEPVKNQFDEKTNITAVSGGASMFRAGFFKDVGLFDEDFFAYYEDVDLGLRGQLRGWTYKFIPEAKAFHATGTTSSRVAGFTIYQQLKNQPLLFIKNVPTRLLPFMLPRFIIAYLSIAFGNVAHGNILPVTRGILAALFYTPKKILQRLILQRRKTVSSRDFSCRIVNDIPQSNRKLKALQNSYNQLVRKKRSKQLSVGIDGTPFFRPVDGIGRYSSNIITSLAAQHPETSFTIIGFKGDTPNKELVNGLPKSVKFHYIPLPRRLYQGIFSRILPFNLGVLTPNFDHVIHLNFTLFPYLKNWGTAHTLFIHDATFVDIPEVVTPKNLTYLKKRVPWSIKRTSHIATISEFTKTRIQDIYSYLSKETHMVGTGVDSVFFSKARKPEYLPEKYILAIGTLEPRKNLESLVRAYLMLPKSLQKEYVLVIGGSLGWDNTELLKLIEVSDTIMHIGYVEDEDLPGLYQYASLFVFPSLYEGFGMPILEAMASETPVLANDIDLFRSIGEDHLKYVDTKDISSFTQSIAANLTHPTSKSRLTKAREHAKNFDWDDSAKRLWKIIVERRTLA